MHHLSRKDSLHNVEIDFSWPSEASLTWTLAAVTKQTNIRKWSLRWHKWYKMGRLKRVNSAGGKCGPRFGLFLRSHVHLKLRDKSSWLSPIFSQKNELFKISPARGVTVKRTSLFGLNFRVLYLACVIVCAAQHRLAS